MPPPPAIPVPARLVRPHPLVAATGEALRGLRPGADCRLEPRRRAGIVHLRVAPASLGRALRIAQAVLVEAQRRGHRTGTAGGPPRGWSPAAGIVIDGRAYPFDIWELTRPVALTEAERARWATEHSFTLLIHPGREPPASRPQADGRLRLVLERRYDGARSSWSDGPRGLLETKLASVLAEVERRAEADRARDEARRQAELRRAEELERRREQEHIQLRERERVQGLLDDAAAWRRVAEVKDYIAAVRSRVADLEGAQAERVLGWCEWAARWAQDNDPLRALSFHPGLAAAEGVTGGASPGPAAGSSAADDHSVALEEPVL